MKRFGKIYISLALMTLCAMQSDAVIAASGKKNNPQTKKSVVQKNTQTSFFSQCATSVCNAGSHLLAPFRASTEEEKGWRVLPLLS